MNTTLPVYRCTLPNRYPAGSAGHKDPSAREGHYVRADSMAGAVRSLQIRLGLGDDEPIDIETPVAHDAPVTITAAQACDAMAALNAAAHELAYRSQRALDIGLGAAAGTRVVVPLPPVERARLPESIQKDMRRWRDGLADIPSAYVEWHFAKARVRLCDFQLAGFTVWGSQLVSAGDFDGMRVLRATVRTPTGRELVLVWHDGNQDFMVDTGHGHVLPSADDLR